MQNKHLAPQLAMRERVYMHNMVVKRGLVLFMRARGLGVRGTPKQDVGHARFWGIPCRGKSILAAMIVNKNDQESGLVKIKHCESRRARSHSTL
ncbi:hypothetical protein NDU88_001268 [Pleurodeles waltl]|uniref:Uncharacterized protein n=1 Tax=Pleurodeles waltl TaxID=8319 RepID=A0AAV7Q6K4_PLEWA|nr:hypothetical protein NDU88_001268 [Pleurodeles waltl]